jgi:hypothetical protein
MITPNGVFFTIVHAGVAQIDPSVRASQAQGPDEARCRLSQLNSTRTQGRSKHPKQGEDSAVLQRLDTATKRGIPWTLSLTMS